MRPLLLALALTATAQAQWEILPTPTTADLRGIHAVSPKIAWASGTNGTVLRTVDGGSHWAVCPTPPGAEKLDFRGIQAFDAQTAIVMSSGKGALSRLYKTTDACAHWTLLFTNPDPEGFWDCLAWDTSHHTIYILGDPVAGKFRLFSQVGPEGKFTTTLPEDNPSAMNGRQIRASLGESAFATSNSLLLLKERDGMLAFITGGGNSEFILYIPDVMMQGSHYSDWNRTPLPLARSAFSGAFSVETGPTKRNPPYADVQPVVVVGGDYRNPDSDVQTAAVSNDSGLNFHPAQTPPRGFRSSVAYSPATKTWITVGPNGTDISTDDGRNWRPLRPGKASDGTPEPPDSDRNWNALSLPYVVGPRGRIGKLRPTALP